MQSRGSETAGIVKTISRLKKRGYARSQPEMDLVTFAGSYDIPTHLPFDWQPVI